MVWPFGKTSSEEKKVNTETKLDLAELKYLKSANGRIVQEKEDFDEIIQEYKHLPFHLGGDILRQKVHDLEEQITNIGGSLKEDVGPLLITIQDFAKKMLQLDNLDENEKAIAEYAKEVKEEARRIGNQIEYEIPKVINDKNKFIALADQIDKEFSHMLSQMEKALVLAKRESEKLAKKSIKAKSTTKEEGLDNVELKYLYAENKRILQEKQAFDDVLEEYKEEQGHLDEDSIESQLTSVGDAIARAIKPEVRNISSLAKQMLALNKFDENERKILQYTSQMQAELERIGRQIEGDLVEHIHDNSKFLALASQIDKEFNDLLYQVNQALQLAKKEKKELEAA